MEVNINKLFLIIENLQFEETQNQTSKQRIQKNVETIQNYIKLNINELHDNCLKEIDCPIPTESGTDSWNYVCYLFYILLEIHKGVNFESAAKEDLISLNHMNDLTKAVVDASCYGVRLYLHKSIRQHPIFKREEILEDKNDYHIKRLTAGLNLVEKFLKIKTFTSRNSSDSVILDAMAGCYTMLIENKSQDIIKKYSLFLNYLWENTLKEKYFKNLLILKSILKLPVIAQKKLHSDLMEKLTYENGFGILARNIVKPIKDKDETTTAWKYHEVIAKIIAHPSHNEEFITKIIPQIFNFIHSCLHEDDDFYLVGAGIVTLRKLYSINENYKKIIEKKIEEYLVCLYDPQELLTGFIVMENREFKTLLDFLFTSFCSSSLEPLPSELLVKYLHLFLNIFNQLPNDSIEQGQMKSVIIKCLANREKPNLQRIIKDIILENFNNEYKILHPRIVIHFNEKFNSYTVQISPSELENTFDISNVLPKILKTSNNNI